MRIWFVICRGKKRPAHMFIYITWYLIALPQAAFVCMHAIFLQHILLHNNVKNYSASSRQKGNTISLVWRKVRLGQKEEKRWYQDYYESNRWCRSLWIDDRHRLHSKRGPAIWVDFRDILSAFTCLVLLCLEVFGVCTWWVDSIVVQRFEMLASLSMGWNFITLVFVFYKNTKALVWIKCVS